MHTSTHTTFSTIRIEGAILPPDLLQRIADGDASVEGLAPEAYHLAKGEKINEAINRAWNRVLGAWATFRDLSAKLAESDPGTTLTRERWLLPLFQELGYGRLATAKAIEIAGDAYPISHGWQNTPIHLVGLRVDLDTRTKGVAGAARNSPHSLVQILLNRSDAHLWAFVSNGLRLRVLRDNKMLTRQAFVEFDLQAMMDGQVYSDFVLLWLVCHQSRVEAERPEECWLEKWSRAAAEQGTRALDQLRGGVEEAISALGRGFLAHPANRNLRDKLYAGKLDAQDYYRQLLRLVYRLIFLFVTEDRGLLFNPNTDAPTRDIFSRFYSTAKLRALAERRRGTRHADLYHGLRLVMEKLGGDLGCIELGLPALGGFLFSAQAIPDLVASPERSGSGAEGCEIANHDLLDAIRALAFTMDRSARRVVDYKNLGSEELGSVYESLLELHPIINSDAHSFELKTASGNERKTTGSFYTPTPLINVLLDSALDPILDEAYHKSNPEQAILALMVCDSAGGSGHIAIAAARRIAKRLATIRTGDEEPSPEAMRTALRDVITHCIYVVDVNPMAIELCKVNLWMEMQDPRYPLSFLDAHIKCGNSLIGVAPGMDISEIPDEAFNPVTGDHKPTASALKKRNKGERTSGQLPLMVTVLESLDDLQRWVIERARQLNAMPEDNATQVQAKSEAYRQLTVSENYVRRKLEYDLWTAAFFWQVQAPDTEMSVVAPTQSELAKLRRGEKLNPDLVRQVQAMAERLRFFHWELEFPEVFEQGGFDVNLSNPPWERIKLQEREFFSQSEDGIAQVQTAAARQKMIKSLMKEDSAFAREYIEDLRQSECESKFIRVTGRFPLTAVGDINTYALFVELSRQLLKRDGRAGIICPTGIVSDVTTEAFFRDLIQNGHLVSLTAFVNEKYIFPGVVHNFRFCALALSRTDLSSGAADFVYECETFDEVKQVERHYSLSKNDFALINPNTHTAPIFRTRLDAELVKKIFTRIPVLVNEPDNINPWGAEFATMFHMSNDSNLFHMPDELGEIVSPSVTSFSIGEENWVRLYEAKMIHQYDHRFAHATVPATGQKLRGTSVYVTESQHAQSDYNALPRYWVRSKDVENHLSRIGKWFLGFRKITGTVNNIRTTIFSVLPIVGVGDSLALLSVNVEAKLVACLLGCFNSLVLDYVVRQKISGINLNFYHVRQFPILSPTAYAPADIDFIAPRVLELVYTAWDMKPFAEDMGYHGEPFRWDEERRAQLRAELDAYYARLYGLTRDELRYILDPRDVYGDDFPGETFRVLKDKEIKQYGEYRTRRLVLEKWDALTVQR